MLHGFEMFVWPDVIVRTRNEDIKKSVKSGKWQVKDKLKKIWKKGQVQISVFVLCNTV